MAKLPAWIGASGSACLSTNWPEDGGAKPHIEALCRKLKVTRGSFYWHFHDRREFDEALIEYWDLVFTRGPMEQHRAMQGSGKDRLLWLMEIL